MIKTAIAIATGMATAAAAGAALTAEQAARAFGAREGVQQVSLSPDGKQVAIVAPRGPRGSVLLVVNPEIGGQPKAILAATGEPERLTGCRWSTDARIVCNLYFQVRAAGRVYGYTRAIAINSDGSNQKILTPGKTTRAVGTAFYGGNVIDWLGDGKGDVLMTRSFIPEDDLGTKLAQSKQGLGVERVDTETLQRRIVEQPKSMAVDYVTDGRGTVRIMGLQPSNSYGYDQAEISYFFRPRDSRTWQPLGKLTGVRFDIGFNPYAVDPDLNVVYGFERKDGRQALYRITLDNRLKRELVLARPDVDIDELVRIGRQKRVVGVSYATEQREVEFFDPELRALSTSLARALPNRPLVGFEDASDGEKRLLLSASSDTTPGSFYVYDKASKNLLEVLPIRPELAGVPLGTMKPVSYTAADGTSIPAYLTLPPGSSGKNLPAIVMPHGGPEARDEWGFDWWAQFFAARGYAVLQPQFRGSAGYGEAWFQKNGFQSWRTAIGDVNDAGRWLAKQGIAAPGKLAVVGWSYGGYAALQSAVLDPALFKAIVAVAPVTDLQTLANERRDYSDFQLTTQFIGNGPHIREGSPARNARTIAAPVLMFHGDQDQNVGIVQSRLMADQLRDAGKRVQLVEYKGLEHSLVDSAARADMLAKSDAFLRASLGL